MSLQYINLLAPEFRPRRLWLTLDRLMAFFAMALLAVSGIHLYEAHKLDGLREEITAAAGLMKTRANLVSAMRAEQGAKKSVSPIENEVQRLEFELKSARESMKVLEGGEVGSRSGFSGYFEAFSRQAIDGLWLTGFSVSGDGNVVIRGRVVRADLVPEYLQRLNRELVLQGREFSGLDLHRPKVPPVKGAAPDAVASPPPFLEFALMTELQSPANVTAKGPAK